MTNRLHLLKQPRQPDWQGKYDSLAEDYDEFNLDRWCRETMKYIAPATEIKKIEEDNSDG